MYNMKQYSFTRNRYIKKVICACMFVLLLFQTVEPLQLQAAKKDNIINWLIEQKMVNSDFQLNKIKKNPNSKITRQEFLSVVVLACKKKGSVKQGEKLICADKDKINVKLLPYIGTADQYGILQKVSKDGKTKIQPTKAITKQMAAYYLGRCLTMSIDLDMPEYSDYSKVDQKCVPYVTAFVRTGIFNVNSNKIDPLKKLTWKEAGTLIKKVYDRGYFDWKEVKIVTGGDLVGNLVSDATLKNVTGIVEDEVNHVIYLADSGHNQIKAIKNGASSIISGKKFEYGLDGSCTGGYVDGALEKAIFNNPTSLCVAKEGILVLDKGNQVIRYIDLKEKKVTTYAGSGMKEYQDGDSTKASFCNPNDMAIDDSGNVYVADTGNNCIRKVDIYGTVTTLAGNPMREGYQDGNVTIASFNQPTGIAVYNSEIYVADCGNQRIRKISNGIVTTVAGSSTEYDENCNEYVGGFCDGNANVARFNYPRHIQIDKKGIIYVSDTGNSMIRKIDNGVVSTVAGFGVVTTQTDFSWDNYLVMPSNLVIDNEKKQLYVTDSFKNHMVRMDIK